MATAIGEKTKQSCMCLPGVRSIAPAHNSRNDVMFSEATKFSHKLIACEKQIKLLKKATDGMMKVADKTLTEPMPMVYELDPITHKPKVVESWTPMREGSPHTGSMQKSVSLELKQEALDPIASWQAEYKHAKLRMAEVTKAQLELDANRRRLYNQQAKHIKKNAKTADAYLGEMPGEEQDPHLMAARTKYVTMEEQMHQELIKLAHRARTVQKYLSRAMQLESQALAESAEAVESGGTAPSTPNSALGYGSQKKALGFTPSSQSPTATSGQSEMAMAGGGYDANGPHPAAVPAPGPMAQPQTQSAFNNTGPRAGNQEPSLGTLIQSA